MPRRGRSSPMMSRPAPAPSRQMSTMPARPPAAAPPALSTPMQAQPKQPGLMAQMATTAAGVAVGSAVGHSVGHAITGGGGGGQQESVPVVSTLPAHQQHQQYYDNPCQQQMQQFLDCAQNNSDITLCYGFNEALRQCKIQNGMQV